MRTKNSGLKVLEKKVDEMGLRRDEEAAWTDAGGAGKTLGREPADDRADRIGEAQQHDVENIGADRPRPRREIEGRSGSFSELEREIYGGASAYRGACGGTGFSLCCKGWTKPRESITRLFCHPDPEARP